MDWLQLDKRLDSKPQTLRLRAATGEPMAEIVYRLIRFWIWVDDHLDGPRIPFDDLALLDAKFGGGEKFWLAMIEVGWLARLEGALAVADWKKRFSQSAKCRAQKAKRQSTYRANKARRQAEDGRGAQALAGDDTSATPAPCGPQTSATQAPPRKDETRRDENRKQIHPRALDAPAAPRAAAPLALKDGANTANGGKASAPRPRPLPSEDQLRSVDWEAAGVDVAIWRRKLGLSERQNQSDALLLYRLAAVKQLAGERLAVDAIEATRVAYAGERPPAIARCGYLHGVVRSKLEEIGWGMQALFAQLAVPRALLNGQAAPRRIGEIIAAAG